MNTTRPNILMIVVDCARSDRWHGPHKSARTPLFDQLAAEGCACVQTVAETSATTPCFASLLTGAFSFHHGIAGVGGYRLADDLPTLAEALAASGYTTYAEVTGPLLPAVGLARGFDEYNYRVAYDYLHTGWGERFVRRLSGGAYKSPWFLLLHLWELHLPRQVATNRQATPPGNNLYDRSVSSLDAQLTRVMSAASRHGPLLTIVTGDHGEKTRDEQYRPGTAVDEIRWLYHADDAGSFGVAGAARLIGPAGMFALRSRFQPQLERFSMRQTPRDLAPSRWRSLLDRLALLRLAPRLRPLDYLRIRDPERLTSILAQRGELDPQRTFARLDRLIHRVGAERLFDLYIRMWVGQFRQQIDEGHVLAVYDYLTRVPLVLHWPGHLPTGRKIDKLVRQVDIAPTLLELVGIRPRASFAHDGRSFAGLLSGQAWDEPPAYQGVAGQPLDLTIRGIRTATHRLTYGAADPQVPVELYDLRSDPAEQHNLAAAEPEHVEQLRQQAEAMLPAGGVRIERADPHDMQAGAELEARLRDLGYVE